MKTVLVIYLAAMLLIGIWANRFTKNTTDFLLAGRRLGLGLATFTMVATYFGGGVVMGYAETAYSKGLVTWWNGIGSGLGFICLGFMAFKMRDLALCTVPDYLLKRFESPLIRLLASALSLFALIGLLGGNVGAAGSILEMMGWGTGIQTAFIACLIFIIYTSIGGLWAATITDFVQISIATVGIISVFVIKLIQHGGWSNISAQLSTIDTGGTMQNLMGNGDFSYIVWMGLPILLYTLIGQDIYQRLFATKSPKVARSACFISGIAFMAISVVPVLLGMIGKVEYPLHGNPSRILPSMTVDSLSPVFAGIVLAAIMAAIMSTGSSLLTAAASHIINDIYIGAVHGGDLSKIEDRKLLTLTRISTVLVGLLSVFCALLIPQILSLMLYSYTLYTSGVFVPVVGGFLWKKGNKYGAMASMACGFTVAVLSFTGITFMGIPTDIFAAIVSAFFFIVVSIMTKTSKEVVA